MTDTNNPTSPREELASAIARFDSYADDATSMEFDANGYMTSVDKDAWLLIKAAALSCQPATSATSAQVQPVSDTDQRADPVAWRYTIHLEFGQTRSKITEAHISPFGVPGEDHSEEYAVTCEPLYAIPQSQGAGQS